LSDSNLHIFNSSFLNNEGLKGGSLEISNCNSQIIDSSFMNCHSLDTGGAIFYEGSRPLLQNLTF